MKNQNKKTDKLLAIDVLALFYNSLKSYFKNVFKILPIIVILFGIFVLVMKLGNIVIAPLTQKETISFGYSVLSYFISTAMFLSFVVLFLFYNLYILNLLKYKGLKTAIIKSFKREGKYILLFLLVVLITLLWSILLFLPGVGFAIFFCLSFIIFVEEDKGVIASVKSSKNLVRGSWWETFVRVVLFVVVFYPVIIIHFYYPTQGSLLSEVLFYILAVPVGLIYLRNIYINLKQKNKKKKVSVWKKIITVIFLISVIVSYFSLNLRALNTEIILNKLMKSSVDITNEITKPVSIRGNEKGIVSEKSCTFDEDCIWAKGCCRVVPANNNYPVVEENSCDKLCDDNESFESPLGAQLKCVDNQCVSSGLIMP